MKILHCTSLKDNKKRSNGNKVSGGNHIPTRGHNTTTIHFHAGDSRHQTTGRVLVFVTANRAPDCPKSPRETEILRTPTRPEAVSRFLLRNV